MTVKKIDSVDLFITNRFVLNKEHLLHSNKHNSNFLEEFFMNLKIMTLVLLTASVGFSQALSKKMKLVDLSRLNRPIYIKVNKSIAPTSKYDTRQFEVTNSSMMSWIMPDSEKTYRLTFSFKRSQPYGSTIQNMFLPIVKGTLMAVTEIKDKRTDINTTDSSMYLAAETAYESLGDGQQTASGVFIQILESDKESMRRLTIQDLESLFKGLISIE